MKYLNKLATVVCGAALGILTLTGCEGSELYGVSAPDNLQDIIDSIAATKVVVTEDLSDCQEDVYTVGATDYSTGWWAAFSKYYQIPDKKKFKAQFQLSINPDAKFTYKNFALIISNDEDRGAGEGIYKEYGAIRFDNQPSGNSEWGDLYIGQHRDRVESNLTFATDTEEGGVQKLGGTITLTVDRARPDTFEVRMTNGVVTKTFLMPESLPNLNLDPSNDKIRIFIVPEGSYINFLKANIEPIGGFTSADDKQPASMEINGVPNEVQLTEKMELDTLMKTVSATVHFDGVPAPIEVPANELLFYTDDDLNSVGEKTILVVYNKTFKGENAQVPLIKKVSVKIVAELSAFTQKVVFPMPQILGAEDNSTPWWTAFTENIKVEPRQTAVVSFTNYGSEGANWNNYNIILNKADFTEYAVVRADNFGWGDGYAACTHELTNAPADDDAWPAWRKAMNGAHVTAYITNNGNGTADIKTVAKGTDGVEYVQTYTGINKVVSDDMYFRFVVDGSHLVFDKEVGAPDCTTPWWTAFSDNIQIPANTACSVSFINYTSGGANWNNFNVILNKADLTEYAVVRSDNYGWGDGYAACTPTRIPMPADDAEWATWRSAMNGAKVDLTITNHGNGTADVKAVMHGTDGVDYTQSYNGINKIDQNDLYFRFVVDGSYISFYPAAASGKRFIQVGRSKVLYR